MELNACNHDITSDLFLFFSVLDVEVLEHIPSLSRSNDTKVLTQSILLEELLGKVLDVTLGKDGTGSNSQSDNVLVGYDSDGSTEVTGASFDLEGGLEE